MFRADLFNYIIDICHIYFPIRCDRSSLNYRVVKTDRVRLENVIIHVMIILFNPCFCSICFVERPVKLHVDLCYRMLTYKIFLFIFYVYELFVINGVCYVILVYVHKQMIISIYFSPRGIEFSRTRLLGIYLLELKKLRMLIKYNVINL